MQYMYMAYSFERGTHTLRWEKFLIKVMLLLNKSTKVSSAKQLQISKDLHENETDFFLLLFIVVVALLLLLSLIYMDQALLCGHKISLKVWDDD